MFGNSREIYNKKMLLSKKSKDRKLPSLVKTSHFRVNSFFIILTLFTFVFL